MEIKELTSNKSVHVRLSIKKYHTLTVTIFMVLLTVVYSTATDYYVNYKRQQNDI